jgi:hypothetical protein
VGAVAPRLPGSGSRDSTGPRGWFPPTLGASCDESAYWLR